MTQWKFVTATYIIESVFIVPADWKDDQIGIKWNKLEYNGEEYDPVWDATEFDFKRPTEIEISPDGENYNISQFEDWIEENAGKDEFQIQK